MNNFNPRERLAALLKEKQKDSVLPQRPTPSPALNTAPNPLAYMSGGVNLPKNIAPKAPNPLAQKPLYQSAANELQPKFFSLKSKLRKV